MYRKNGHEHDYDISDQRDKEIIWQYCIIIISGESFLKIWFIDDFIPSRSLCIKVLLGIYRQALKTVHKSMTQYYYIEERRTLIVSDILHGVLVLVHPNLHLPCWELFDEHVRNRNDCILYNLPLRTKILSRGHYYYTTILECYN